MADKTARKGRTGADASIAQQYSPGRGGVRTCDDLIDAFKDHSVIEAIGRALGPYIAKAIDTALERKLATLQQKFDDLEATVETVKADNARLRALVDGQGSRLEDMEVYSRAHDLIVRGLPEASYAERATASVDGTSMLPSDSHSSVSSSILRLCCDKLDVKISPEEISVAHRLKQGKNDKFRPVIVRFTNRRVRDEILRAKKKLMIPRGSSEDRIFISEHLTRTNASIFFEARKLVFDKKLAAAWSHKGLINVRFTSDTLEKPTIIRKPADFNRVRP